MRCKIVCDFFFQWAFRKSELWAQAISFHFHQLFLFFLSLTVCHLRGSFSPLTVSLAPTASPALWLLGSSSLAAVPRLRTGAAGSEEAENTSQLSPLSQLPESNASSASFRHRLPFQPFEVSPIFGKSETDLWSSWTLSFCFPLSEYVSDRMKHCGGLGVGDR